ncbi:MAG: hypothetical protein LBT66_09405 [Methanobrevibacter sp.]|jgi:hypothetical protein|nr:hypothetical protein [Candidatus Methanovirga meridionalis]
MKQRGNVFDINSHEKQEYYKLKGNQLAIYYIATLYSFFSFGVHYFLEIPMHPIITCI